MGTLEEWLAERGEDTAWAIAGYIEAYIGERWEPVLRQDREALLRLFDRAGEGAAYGTYAQKLFRPVHQRLKDAGFRAEPAFPGTLSTSREWGPPEERERWMWSVLRRAGGAPVGTIVTRLSHDHTRFHIPRPPGVLALDVTEAAAIVTAVARAAGRSGGREA